MGRRRQLCQSRRSDARDSGALTSRPARCHRAPHLPLASRLGLMGRKPVHSFEEVLWLTGALDERYTRVAVDALRAHMRAIRPDVVYSEFNLAAVIAARAEGIPCVGSGSQPTTASYASNPRKSAGFDACCAR